MQIPQKNIEIGALCAALCRFEVGIRILVPMLYITFLYIISLCSKNWVPDEKNDPRAKYEYEPMNKFKSKVQHNNNDNYNNGVPGAAGGVGKARFQESDLDTLRDGRKGDPQHKCCGKKYGTTDGRRRTDGRRPYYGFGLIYCFVLLVRFIVLF